jgi:hypothetical protein
MRSGGVLVLPGLIGLAALAAVLAACAPGPGSGPSPDPRTTAAAPSSASGSVPAPSPPASSPSGTPGAATADLEVVVVRAPGEPEQRWTLRCSGPTPLPGSTHPTAGAACALVASRPEVLAPPARDRVCTQQYGGPEAATVSGMLSGAAVSRDFRRTDGCGISDWSAAEALLGPPGGDV